MKNILLLSSLSVLLFSCKEMKPKVPQFIISGQIENLNDSTISLQQGKENFIIVLNNDGSFSDTIYDFEDGYFNLTAGNEYTKLYLKDGFDVFLSLNVEKFDESVRYEGIGAAENNFLAKQLLLSETVNYWDFCVFSEDTFLFKIDSFIDSRNQFIAEYALLIPEFDPNFLTLEKTNNSYLGAYVKEKYASVHKQYKHLETFEVSENFYNFRKNIVLENIKNLKIPFYSNYVETYIDNKIVATDTSEYAFVALGTINREIQNNKLKKEFIYRSAKKLMPEVKKLDEYWALISFIITDKPELKELKKLHRSLNKIKAGADSPLTSFKDINNKTANLADFKGKYVYIDCWAQWCAPCKKEAPFMANLEKKYADKEISFLKISLDQDQAAWHKYVTENHIIENSFILENAFDAAFAKAYLINSIPRFILLDKELKIIDANAARPSTEALSAQLDALL